MCDELPAFVKTEFENSQYYKNILTEKMPQLLGNGFVLESLPQPMLDTRIGTIYSTIHLQLSNSGIEGLKHGYKWRIFVGFDEPSLPSLETAIINRQSILDKLKNFENNPAVVTFLDQVDVDTLIIDDKLQIVTKDSLDQTLEYDLNDEAIVKVYLNTEYMFNQINQYYENFSSNPHIQEFIAYYKLNNISIFDSTITVSTDQKARGKSARRWLTYDMTNLRVKSFMLDNSGKWESIPELDEIHNYLKDSVFVGQRYAWKIATQDKIHAQTSMWNSKHSIFDKKYKVDVLMLFNSPDTIAVLRSGKGAKWNTALITKSMGEMHTEFEKPYTIVAKNP